jgi:hypothetical protein
MQGPINLTICQQIQDTVMSYSDIEQGFKKWRSAVNSHRLSQNKRYLFDDPRNKSVSTCRTLIITAFICFIST